MNRYRHPAFTLIELLVVIAIIAILAAILLPVLNQAKKRGQQAACISNLHELGLALTMYADTYNQYPGNVDITRNIYVWPPRLYSSGVVQNRKAFWCPAALAESAWDPKENPTVKSVIGEDGKIDPFGIIAGATADNGTRFSYGYNDWGLSDQAKPQLGLGGDVNGGLFDGTVVTPAKVRHPSDMIAIGDLRSDAPANDIQFNANLDPTAASQGPANHTQVPCNRHTYHTDMVFADGHVESPLRNTTIDPNNGDWRARWNNDDKPHFEYTWTVPWLPGSGPLEQ
ncbi:MAG: type II secretion system protein [Limisphaerales bacterium]